jgi:hypothetical protein
MPEGGDLRDVGSRIEALLTSLRSVADPTVHERAEELVRLLVSLYGAGLQRIVETIGLEAADGERVLVRLADDDLVASLLVLHGLHPVALESRVQEALERLRPQIGRVDVVGVDEDGVLRLRLRDIEHGFPTPPLLAKQAIEEAIEQSAPEVTLVEIEGLPAPLPAGTQIIPLTAVSGVRL